MIRRYLTFLFLIIFSGSAAAQADSALSRMETAIELSQIEYTMQDSYFLGRTVAAHILNKYKIHNDSQLNKYLNLICYALAINSPAPDWFNGYHVTVLDDSSANAYSTSGGHIFLSRALIDLVSSEDMLASVIAHELAHIQLWHSISELMNVRFAQQLSSDRDRMSQIASGDSRKQAFSESAGFMTDKLFSGGYSQLQEFEADFAAYSMLAASGYNPESLIDLLKILDGSSANRTAGLDTSHPLLSARVANLEKQKNAYRITDNSAVRKNRFNLIVKRNSN